MSPKPGYEKLNIHLPILLGSLAVLVFLTALVFLSARGVLHLFSRPTPTASASLLEDAGRLPPEPRLQANPGEDLAQFREEENAVLHHYGWVDRMREIVHIPIESAMEKLLKRGLPARRSSPKEPQ